MLQVNMMYVEKAPAIIASVPQKEGLVELMKGDSKDTYVFCAPETM